jgi:hypothetical protein
MHDNEVVDLLNHAWSEGSIEDPWIGLLAIVPSKQITLDPTNGCIHRVAEVEPPSGRGGSATSMQCFVRCFGW